MKICRITSTKALIVLAFLLSMGCTLHSAEKGSSTLVASNCKQNGLKSNLALDSLITPRSINHWRLSFSKYDENEGRLLYNFLLQYIESNSSKNLRSFIKVFKYSDGKRSSAIVEKKLDAEDINAFFDTLLQLNVLEAECEKASNIGDGYEVFLKTDNNKNNYFEFSENERYASELKRYITNIFNSERYFEITKIQLLRNYDSISDSLITVHLKQPKNTVVDSIEAQRIIEELVGEKE